MQLTEFCFMPYSDSREDYRDFIAKHAIDENWGPEKRYLQQYLAANFEIAYQQGKVKVNEDKGYALWRAGNLTTREGSPITILAVKNNLSGKQPYFFKFVFTGPRFQVDLNGEKIPEAAPEPPSYNGVPEYHGDYKLSYNFAHYLEDHAERAAEAFPNLNDHQRFLCIYAALNLAHLRHESTAVAQWYKDKNSETGGYQWLLPLHIKSESISDKPDLVATLEPVDEFQEYNVRTLLPPEWAYPKARAVSRRDPHFRSWA
jgi:hypothetical protein